MAASSPRSVVGVAMADTRHLTAWAAFVALALIATAALLGEDFSASSDDQSLADVRASLQQSWEPGDGLIIIPSWDDGAYAYLTEALPASSPDSPTDAIIRGERLDPLELLNRKRLWVVSRFGRDGSLGVLSAEDVTATSTTGYGSGVSLTRYDLSTIDFGPSLTANIAKLKVVRKLANGKEKACQWRGGAHRCSLDAWLDVKTESRNVYHRDVNWLFAHAGPDGGTLIITWEDVPRARALALRAGFTQASVRNKGGTDTSVTAFIDDREVSRVTLSPYHYGQETRLIEPPPGDETMVVRLEVTAAQSSWRQVMLEANLLSQVPASLSTQRVMAADIP